MTTQPTFPAAQKPKVRRTIPRFAGLRSIMALILREMSTTYGRSPGGYLWAILEPAAGIALLSAIFSIGFRSPGLGTNFSMFYATGMLPFTMFNDIVGKLGQSLNYSKQLLAYPRVTFIDAILARFTLNVMTQVLISYIIFFGIILLFERPLFIISCIFFLFETIPDPYQGWLWYNPLVHVIGLSRRGFYGNYDAPYVSEIYVVGVALTTLLLGLLLLRRNHKSTLER